MIITEQDLVQTAAEMRRRSQFTFALARATQVRVAAMARQRTDDIVRRDQFNHHGTITGRISNEA